MAASGDWRDGGLIRGIGIPPPSGSYRVGVTHFMHKNLFIRLYYPTKATSGYQYVPHVYNSRYRRSALDFFGVKLAGLVSAIAGLVMDTRIPAFLNAPLLNTATPTVDAHTSTDTHSHTTTDTHSHTAPVSFPALVFSHGLGGSFFSYSAVCCDIASHGFIVAALEHKDGSACLARRRVPPPPPPLANEGEEPNYQEYLNEWIPFDQGSRSDFDLRNRQVKERSVEVQQALDILHIINETGADGIVNMLGSDEGAGCGLNNILSQFKGRINTELAAVGGHSFGAATSVQALDEDPRFKCGLLFDIWMLPLGPEIFSTGVTKPVIFINSRAFTEWKENFSILKKLLRQSQDSKEEPNFGSKLHSLYTINGTVHMTQTDAPFVLPPSLYSGAHGAGLSPVTAYHINSDLSLSFLKRHLMKDIDYQGAVPILDGGEGSSEHVVMETVTEEDERKEVLSLL
ncbi:PREDICTED: platelet-activating factor acetylhydrolase-like isoform X1 [Amphimedon queenslandica]|uniref:1-alkyl-2-acetylglycerophosphocholine esterase n=2 Tax=Amphimedon queenslandica TaxID=400682 RepID=A0A1X7UK97_AMPQE|nr:PREDICTED: platelet-activating factor acetylhydrolase-like isoform X1 [Amphimedon queenslandica]|eukprot:XP_003387647.1 PREDICTED: platelet-activating factor acetylhydrolase-like isoform X1 [Amphimedon queenslandica]